MAYFDPADVRDNLLRGLLTDADVGESTRYVEGLAARLGVKAADIKTPVAYPVAQLGLFYALMVCARNASTMSEGKTNDSGEDAYELKRKIYEREYQAWESRITAETFAGDPGVDTGAALPLTARLGRG